MPSSKSSSKPKLKPTQQVSLAFEAIGTHWQIDLSIDHDGVSKLAHQITDRITEFDQSYSRFKADSLVTQMSRAHGKYKLPNDALELFAFYRAMYDATGGSVTPLIGQTLADAGYDHEYSLTPKELSSPPGWDDAISFDADLVELELRHPALLDIGAAGKGYLVDIVSSILTKHGVVEFCVDAGGDMRHQSESGEFLDIGLEDPALNGKVLGVLKLQNKALCGSAGNRRQWAGYNHILDPRSLRSPDHITAVWALADTAMIADGMTTCLYFASPKELQRTFDFEYFILYSDGTSAKSAQFPAEIFSNKTEQHEVR